MKKNLLTLALALWMLTVPALAASGTTDNFVRTRTYGGQFSDLEEGSGFYGNVAALYEYGLTVGRGDGAFGVRDPVTVGQTVIFAARVRSLYASGDAEAGPAAYRAEGQPAYAPYLLYLQSLGVLGDELTGTYADAAPRRTVARILARTLPEGAMPSLNGELLAAALADGRFLPDVGANDACREDILALYDWGVTQGSDAVGSFLPEEPISRGALAAMLTRILDPSLRVTPAWDLTPSYSAAGTSWSDLVPRGTYLSAPSSDEEFQAAVDYMLSQESDTLSLRYPGITTAEARQVMDRALAAVKTACEQCYNAVGCTYDRGTGDLELRFTAAGCTPEELASYRAYTLDAAIAVHDRLWEEGALTAEMNQYDKAKVYFDWICGSCIYDAKAGDSSLSHIAYALFHDGAAVCDGYTGAYNLLLKLEGISCRALCNDIHIWTVAELDGRQYHIDTTWGDSRGGGADHAYFAMTPEQSWNFHTW